MGCWAHEHTSNKYRRRRAPGLRDQACQFSISQSPLRLPLSALCPSSLSADRVSTITLHLEWKAIQVSRPSLSPPREGCQDDQVSSFKIADSINSTSEANISLLRQTERRSQGYVRECTSSQRMSPALRRGPRSANTVLARPSGSLHSTSATRPCRTIAHVSASSRTFRRPSSLGAPWRRSRRTGTRRTTCVDWRTGRGGRGVGCPVGVMMNG